MAASSEAPAVAIPQVTTALPIDTFVAQCGVAGVRPCSRGAWAPAAPAPPWAFETTIIMEHTVPRTAHRHT